HAFHSPQMTPIVAAFEARARLARHRAPQIPMISGLTGRWFEADSAPDAVYWRRHVEEPVLFAEGMRTLAAHGYERFLQVGPGAQLLELGQQSIEGPNMVWLPSLIKGRDDWQSITAS